MQKNGWFDNPKHVQWILVGLYVVCGLLFVLDFILHRHTYTQFEAIPTFYALYGFIACVLLVLVAKAMRKLLMREEDYYEQEEQNSGEEKQ